MLESPKVTLRNTRSQQNIFNTTKTKAFELKPLEEKKEVSSYMANQMTQDTQILKQSDKNTTI